MPQSIFFARMVVPGAYDHAVIEQASTWTPSKASSSALFIRLSRLRMQSCDKISVAIDAPVIWLSTGSRTDPCDDGNVSPEIRVRVRISAIFEKTST